MLRLPRRENCCKGNLPPRGNFEIGQRPGAGAVVPSGCWAGTSGLRRQEEAPAGESAAQGRWEVTQAQLEAEGPPGGPALRNHRLESPKPLQASRSLWKGKAGHTGASGTIRENRWKVFAGRLLSFKSCRAR